MSTCNWVVMKPETRNDGALLVEIIPSPTADNVVFVKELSDRDRMLCVSSIVV
jgi:hypothetical protein